MAKEQRLIDANALRAVLKSEECNCEVFPWAVDNAPTVDAVEVVRCKECKWWDEYHIGSLEGPGIGDGACLENLQNFIDHRGANDFCSHGERRTDGFES